jgi:PAS domain S-box-containing protein
MKTSLERSLTPIVDQTPRKTKVLIVEDEALVAEDLGMTLEILGYEIIGIASTGIEAMALINRNRPDLILMDIILRGSMTGIDTALQVRTQDDIPIIFLTAYSDGSVVEQVKKTDPYGYLIKPVDERELYISIEMGLNKHTLEKRLKESQRWHQTTLRSIGDAIITTDRDHLITFINPIAEQLTGYTLNEAIGNHLSKIYILGQNDEGGLNPARGDASGAIDQLSTNNLFLINRAGKTIPIDETRAPIILDNGQSLGLVVIFRDISKMKAAEIRLQREQAEALRLKNLLEDVIDHMTSGLLVLDNDGKVLMINTPGERILGIERSTVVGKPICDFLQDISAFAKIDPSNHLGQEIVIRSADQREVPIGYHSTILRTGLGEKAGIITIFRDLTEIKELKKKLHAKEKLATIGELARGIAHEIKNPIFAISSGIQVIQHEPGLSNDQKETLTTIYYETMRVDRLVNALLTFGATQGLKPVPVNISQLFDQVIIINHGLAKKRNIQIVNRCDDPGTTLMCDRDKIMQVLLNLVQNALDASEPGTMIELAAELSDDVGCRILVIDEGKGIPEELQARVFEPFFSTKKGSTGLGLPLSRKIILDHGGSLDIEPRRDRGTTFVISLPKS